MFIVDDLVRSHGVDFVPASREDGAVLMAYGYARLRGELGVASVTFGPGLTNALTALTEVARNETPILVLTGHFPVASASDAAAGAQFISHAEVIQPTGATYVRVRSAETAVEDVVRAVQMATIERRVVVLGVPIDLQEGEVVFPAGGVELASRSGPIQPWPDALERAVGIVATIRRPLILAGWGAVGSGARQELVELARRIGAPLATTLFARDFFRGEYGDLGVFGTVSSDLASDVIGRSDCVIVFGASLNWWTTMGGDLLRGKALVRCDTDRASIGGDIQEDAFVLGDAALVAAGMVALLAELDHEPSNFLSPDLAADLADYSRRSEVDDHSTSTTVDVRTAALRLDEILPIERTVVCDLGRFMIAALRYVSVPDPTSFVLGMRFGSIGLGLGMAIGAAFARPEQPVVLFVGDGGLMMSLSELNTAVQHSLDLIVVVMNDGGYGAEYRHFVDRGMDPSLSLLSWPQFAQLAEGFGAAGLTVTNLDELEAAAAAIEHRNGPMVIDIKIDPSHNIPF